MGWHDMRSLKRIPAALLLAVLLLALCGFGPATAAEPTGEGFVIPELTDLPQVDLSDTLFLLANSYNNMGFEYTMPEYSELYGQGISPLIRDEVLAMMSAAKADGVTLYIGVAYRNWEYNTTYYNSAVERYGAEEACFHFQPPGCNEHQTGLAIDVTENMYNNCNYHPYDDSSVYESPVYDPAPQDAHRWP